MNMKDSRIDQASFQELRVIDVCSMHSSMVNLVGFEGCLIFSSIQRYDSQALVGGLI